VQINKTMQQFAQENARMEMTQEMMGDTLDSALDDETTEDDAAELVGQVSRVGGGREWGKGAEHDDTRKGKCNSCGLV
jgi:charged multivesicular body protein 2B